MLYNHLKAAWRNLLKNKGFSFLNILGLTIGLTSFLLISLYIFDELTSDSFHKNANNIYRVIDVKLSAEGKETKVAGAGYQISEKAKNDFSEIKEVIRVATFGRMNISAVGTTNVFYESYTLANASFLTAFDFKLLQGTRSTALKAPHSVVITEDMAEKLFSTTDAVGKTIKTDRDSVPYKVTGVLKNFPVNSHISYDILFSETSQTGDRFKKFTGSDWNSDAFNTYFLVNDKADIHQIETKLNQAFAANQNKATKGKTTFLLQPLKDIHFHSDGIEGNPGKTGNITYIYVFSIVGLFVLFIACINYMNLTTARFASRGKEIAIRKVAGASRENLAAQFLAEAVLVTFIALIFALISAKALLPQFNAFTGKQLLLGAETDYRIWLGIILTIVTVSLLSGIYPALFQSGLKPLQLLKNKIYPGKGNISLRRSLVVFQFTLSIVMIIATMVVYQQMKYINTKDLGFKKGQLVVVDINSGKVRSSAELLKTEFSKLPHVSDVSATSRVPGEWKDLPKVQARNANAGATQGNDMFFLGVDERFLKTYKVTLAKGRNFRAGVADSSAVLINETAAKALGITTPSEQLIEIPSVNFDGNLSALDKPFVARVVGIVKDFNFQSLHEPLAPMVMAFQNNPIQSIDYFTARLNGGDAGSVLKQMDAVLHQVDQNHLLEYHFLDKQWDRFYRDDLVRETIFLLMAVLSIAVACLGLFGLATYAAEQRIKEIGIRKVLGASVRSIVTMLSKDFLRLVFIAAIIAFPIGWWAMERWLRDFAYHITISWWVFAGAACAALAIALFTVSFHAIKAALTNPVKSLRSE